MSPYHVLRDSAAAARQLEREIVQSCREHLHAGASARRAVATAGGWHAHAEKIREIFLSAFPAALWKRAAIEVRPVSRYEFDDFRVENAIFCSLPHWEVNASVYLPKSAGVYPCVICPTGHSSKFSPSYTIPAQIFAQNGYIAVSFCPPGCEGELAYQNDHFINGSAGWLTGFWCQTHFVADALSCIDYLETRKDANLSNGVAMTGVSGGGLTTMYCAAMDERITFFAPVCCVAEQETLHLTDLYTSCPEQHGKDYLKNGLDFCDILALSAPKPLFVIGGKEDEVFGSRATERVFHEVQRAYRLIGAENRAELYMEEGSGHAYTESMALETVARMNRIYQNAAPPLRPKIREMAYEELACHPLAPATMQTINASLAGELELNRPPPREDTVKDALRKLLGLPSAPHCDGFTRKTGEKKVWRHCLQEVVLNHPGGVIPGLFLRRDDGVKRRAALAIDEAGKWAAFQNDAPLCAAAGFPDISAHAGETSVLSVDVSGFGELEPQPAAYDMASWNDIGRILAYLAISNGQCVMGYRVRDALLALDFLKRQPDVDGSRVTIAGRGAGGIVALMAAVLSEGREHAVLWDAPASYKHLCTDCTEGWSHTLIVPDILLHFDLPDLAACLGGRCTVIRPLNAARCPLQKADAEHVYRAALRNGARLYTDYPEDSLIAALKGQFPP